MALSLNDIEISCDDGLSIANELRGYASEMQTQYQRCTSVVSDVQDSWTGANATKYCTLLSERAEAIGEQARLLEELAQAITDTVEVYRTQQIAAYRAEQKARQEGEKKKSTAGKGKKGS